jgi:lysophospholipase L1-like esterase
MVPCVVMGDSIAVGVAEYRPDCEAIAKSGINSERYIETLLQAHTAKTIVISLGVNDDATIDTLDNLREVRRQVRGRTVIWLLPGIRPRAQVAIRTVAQEFGDRLIDTKPHAGPDHLHPTGVGYQRIAAMTENDATLPAQPIPLRATAMRAVHRPHLLINYPPRS